MRKDIYGGLKNALEKGEPLEKAIRSFINAGYPELEVKEAAKSLEMGAMPMVSNTVNNKNSGSLPNPTIAVSPPPKLKKLKTQSSKRLGKIILLIIILLLLISIFTLGFIFRESIITFIENIIS